MDLQFQFDSLSEMFYMSGHGVYVWGCYFITYAGLAYLVLSPWFRTKRFFRIQKAIAKREPMASTSS